MLSFDIETGPLGDDVLQRFIQPFNEVPFQPSKFDPDSIKTGKMKPETAKAKIEGRRKEHEKQQAGLAAARSAAFEEYWHAFRSRAALEPTTGQVLAIGYHAADKKKSAISSGPEKEIIETFWRKYLHCKQSNRIMLGLNIHQFDLPFLVVRSWILEVDIPDGVYSFWKHRINWSETFVDLRSVWLLGRSWSSAKSNFDTLAAAFETGGKPEGVDGGQFAELWETDRKKAEEYLLSDITQPAEWAARMGIF